MMPILLALRLGVRILRLRRQLASAAREATPSTPPSPRGPTVTPFVLIPVILKAWPIIVALCTAVVYASHHDYASALAALGLGGAATGSSHILHRMPPPFRRFPLP